MPTETGGGEDQRVPTELELRVMMFRAMEQMFLHSQSSTELIARIHARMEGVAAGNSAVAEIVDDNEVRAELDRQLKIQKDVISHLFDKSHQYVTVIVAGAFAAYFATLNALAARFSDTELLWSALLMTVSLSVFVMWEVFQMFFIGHHTFKGDYGLLTEAPAWVRRSWYIVLIVTLATAVPAISLSLFVYLRGLGVGALLTRLCG